MLMKMNCHKFSSWLPRGRKEGILVQMFNYHISQTFTGRRLNFSTFFFNRVKICAKSHWNLKCGFQESPCLFKFLQMKWQYPDRGGSQVIDKRGKFSYTGDSILYKSVGWRGNPTVLQKNCKERIWVKCSLLRRQPASGWINALRNLV